MGEVSMRSEDRDHVARAIWDEFCKLRGPGALNPTAREWYVLSGWMDRDIPLPVVLRGFSEFNGRPRKLEAMQVPVEKAYAYYRQAMAL
jgi:hypothetical protein